jgi:PAS domain S-box-containing protein
LIILGFQAGLSWLKSLKFNRTLEALGLALCLFIVSYYALGAEAGATDNFPALLYAPLPFLLWAAIRFNHIGVHLAILVITIFSVGTAANGLGPFTSSSPIENVLSVQFYLIATAVPIMLLSAVLSQHRLTVQEKNNAIEEKDKRSAELVIANEEKDKRAAGLVIANEQIELLSHVANASNAGVVICDNQRKVVWVNAAFTSLTGYVLDELMGNDLGALLQGPNTDTSTVQKIGRELAEDKDVSVEILNYRKNGSEYWNNLLISAVKDSGGDITHYVGIQNDITDKKQQEKMTINSQRLDAIGQLSGGICHDFNNILGILSSNMDVLKIKNKDADLDTLLGSMETAILRGSAVTSRLLKLTKQQSEVAEVVDVDHELASAVEMLAQTVRKNIVINSSFHSGKTAFIHKDALVDAVINLIINAQHAIEHHGDIVVSSHNVETFNYDKEEVLISEPKTAHGYIQISVRDTGCGIPQESIPKIFDSLFSTRSHQTGTGLGLNILIKLVKNEGVGLTVQSQVGIGTNFNLWLPEAIDKLPIKEDTVIKTTNIAGLKIVFIDDEISLLDVVKSYLESVGAIMTCFSNAEEALNYIDRHNTSIDLVITDNNMPGSVQGQDVYRHVTQNYTGLPCLVMTGYAGDVSSYAQDADILQKPIRLMQLKNVIADSYKRATKIG